MKINHYKQHIITKQNDPTKNKISILTVVALLWPFFKLENS